MKTVFALVAVLLVASSAHAQDFATPSRNAGGKHSAPQSLRALSNAPIDQPTIAILKKEHDDADALNDATWFYIATASADWSVTAVCARVMCGDKTQSGLFLHGVEPKWAIPIGVAIDAAIVLGVRELVAPDHPKIARALLYGLGGTRLLFVTYKVNDLRAHAVRIP
jgi:hypothetical protein